MARFDYPSRQLILRNPTLEDYKEIYEQFYNNILKNEPGTQVRGGYPHGIPLKIKDDIKKFLNQELSLVAIDTTNESICGFAINYLIKR